MKNKKSVAGAIEVLEYHIKDQERQRELVQIFSPTPPKNDDKSNAILIHSYNEEFYEQLKKGHEVLVNYMIYKQGTNSTETEQEGEEVEGSPFTDKQDKE